MKKIIIVLFLIIIAIVIIFAFQQNWYESEEKLQKLNKEEAIVLVRDKLIEGKCNSSGVAETYRSCILDIEEISDENIWLITVIYEGFFDDSVRGSRLRVNVASENGGWVIVGEPIEDFQCWHGRGHEDFSTEFCI
jgi:urease gamma subunit